MQNDKYKKKKKKSPQYQEEDTTIYKLFRETKKSTPLQDETPNSNSFKARN